MVEQGPHEETYAGDDRAAREARADAQGGMRRVVARLDAEAASDVYAEGQARRLGIGMPTRGGPEMPGTDYLGYEHPAMKQMVETNMDPGQVNDTGAGWNSLGNALVEFADAVAAAVGRSREDWSGTAGEAAREYLSGLGKWLGETGRAAQLAANRLNAQSEAAAGARAGMPEPVDFSMNDAIGMLERETDPFALRDTISLINQRFDEKQRAHERAAEVMTSFAQSMGESGAGMPVFMAVPAMAAPAEAGSDRPDVGGRGRGDISWPPGGGPEPASMSEPPGDHGPDDGSPAGGDGGPTGSQDWASVAEPGHTPAQGWEQPAGGDQGARPVGAGPTGAVAAGGGTSSDGPGSGGGTRVPGRSGGPGGRPGGAAGDGATGRGGPESGNRSLGRRLGGGEAAGGARSGGGGPESTARSPGERLGGGENGGPRSGRGPEGARSPGGRLAEPGVRDGAAGEPAAGRGGGRGAAGGLGAGPVGVGRGRGAEDLEHTRPSWLEEPDPEGVFGSDQPVAPAVIGEE